MKKRILIINPVGTGKWNESDKKIYQSFASSNTEIDVVSLDKGPESIETREAEAKVIPYVVKKALELHEKYDGIIVNCCLDPGVEIIRSLIKTPTIGPCQASLAIASTIGKKIGIVTVSKTAPPLFNELVARYGMENKVVSIKGIKLSVPEINNDRTYTIELLKKEVAKVVKDGANTVILGCTGLAGFAKELQKSANVPIVDPVGAAIKVLEDIIELNLFLVGDQK